MNRIGISTATFFSKCPTEDSFKLIDQLGIEVAEVFLTTFMEYEKDFVDMIASVPKKVEIYSVHSLNQQFEPELFNKVARTRNDSEYYFRKMAYAMRALGAKYYTFHGPARLKRTPYRIDFPSFGKRVNELNSIIDEYQPGGQILYENVHWTYFSYPGFYTELKPYAEVKTCLDIKQAMQSKVSVFEYIDAMQGSIGNVHLCDYDETGKLAVCGKGIVDFTALFRYLIEKGYDGPLMMELYANDYDSFDEVRESYEFLQNCLEKAKH